MSDRTDRAAHGPAPLVVVGDALLDRDLAGTAERLAPDAPVPVIADCVERLRPGGAALAAHLAALDGRPVTLITGLGDDPAARLLRRLLEPQVRVIALPVTGPLPEKTRLLAQHLPVARVDRGDGRAAAATDEAAAAIRSAHAVLVSDYGRGAAEALRDVLAERPPEVWDPHPRGAVPVPGTRLVTPAEKEARLFAEGGRGDDLRTVSRGAAALVRAWRAAAVVVTLGARGALLSYGDNPLLFPAPTAHPGDPCGAGDRFAATAAGRLADGALVEEAVADAVASATAFVAAGAAGAIGLDPSPDTPERPAPEPAPGHAHDGTGSRLPADAGPGARAGRRIHQAGAGAGGQDGAGVRDGAGARGGAGARDGAGAGFPAGAEPGVRAAGRIRTVDGEAGVRDRAGTRDGAGAGVRDGAGASVRDGAEPGVPAGDPNPAGAGADVRDGTAAGVRDGAGELLGRGGGRRAGVPAAGHREAEDPCALAERVRAAGGTVVAAGGCFDLLHAGHVGLLEEARRLGDCLVVCVNSDSSVRRRKGDGRPVNPLADRVRVLKALACVDAVAVFDEDTPEQLLARLRPDVWVKGGDYAGADLPEAALLEEWGGQAVLLPYLDGRSSTRLAARAAAAVAAAREGGRLR
ncbi:D-glycero-beta-D-manno-heptose 1-phosphate adenylyltransferase [Streptomyces sp. NPDC005012]|uniref:D-glycero-beta-D-manno-heptose 1-phosphate adenylyltransferase n=1 Tax=Streptomyces sp. NPDC005012 TaxID=3154558 RepID=UPI0033A58A0D